jgi:hypothetical protein
MLLRLSIRKSLLSSAGSGLDRKMLDSMIRSLGRGSRLLLDGALAFGVLLRLSWSPYKDPNAGVLTCAQ